MIDRGCVLPRQHPLLALVVAVIVAPAVVVVTLTSFEAAAAPVAAQRAGDFVESVGVGGQFAKDDGVYAENYAAVKDAIRELGVRYYRTAAAAPRAAAVADDFSRSLGLKGVFHVSNWDKRKANGVVPGSAAGVIDALTAKGTGGILAVEGPNELNHGGPSDWAQQLRDYQLAIYTHVKSDPRLNGVLVASPTLVTNADHPKPSVTLGMIRDRIDIGAMHDYVADGGAPESRFRASAAMLRANNFGPGPLLITETGVCTEWQAVKARTPSQKCVSEKAQAKYLPRNLLDKFDENPRNKAFIFELVTRSAMTNAESSGGDGWWGWGVIDHEMHRKPAFYAVRNLMRLLQDESADFAPAELDYSLKGQGNAIRQVLLQKRDGRFYLILWQPVRSFDKDSNTDIDPPAVPITLQLKRAANVALYRPTPIEATEAAAASLQPFQSFPDSTSIDLQVPDHVLVVEIAPAA